MVNRGKPSLGCFTCKDSRVKCDLQKPSCKRCLRLTGRCSGYPSSWELVHRQQNDLVAQQVQARVDKQGRRRDLNDVSPPQPPLGSPFTVCSVFKLYDDYFLNSGMGIFEALPVLGSGKHAPCFSHALNAAALASGAGQLHQSGALIRARQAYGDAILMLRRSMQDLTVRGDDSVLATLFVLGFFEVLVQQLPHAEVQGIGVQCHPHGKGALAMLLSRVQRGLDTQLDRNLFIFCRHIQIMDIFSKKADPASLRTEFEGPWMAWPGFYPVDPIVQASVDLLAEIENTMGLNRSKTHIMNVADQVRRVLGILDLIVSQVSPDSSSPAYFNGLLRNDSATSAAIAKSLYLTVRLHLVDALLRSFDAQIHIAEANDDLLSQIPEWLVIEQEAGLRTLWEEVTAALAPSRQATEAKNAPGTASRMFCLSWPMAAISQSTMASEQWKGRVWELIDKDSGQ
ncbi:Zn(2)-C6 fungal-type domain-containing protein [Fusarium sp. LHS14.1]|nr:Zn(2)-C6 fungal-type domain-containing protein [Fusarium sp. LHS14.1]